MPFLNYKPLKLQLTVFLAGCTVTMVTYYVMERTTMDSPIFGKFFDTMIVASSDKECHKSPSKSKCWKVFGATLTNVTKWQYRHLVSLPLEKTWPYETYSVDFSSPGHLQYVLSSHIQELVVPYTLSQELRLSSAVFSMHIFNFRKSQAEGTHARTHSSCQTSLIQKHSRYSKTVSVVKAY